MRLLIPCGLTVLALSLAGCGPGKLSHWPNSTMGVSQCSAIKQATPGSEDIVVAGRYAFISSDPRRSDKRRSGAIYAYDLANRGPATLARDPTPSRRYRPHGMGLFTGPDGKQLLFVVTHPGEKGEREEIEIFSVDGPRLIRVDSIYDPALIRGNDVIPVGQRRFYVTNSHVSRTELGRSVEAVLTRGHSYVLYYDGSGYRQVERGLSFANSVNVSADGRLLYVTTSIGKDLRVYQREANGNHRRLQRIRLESGADNVEVDSSGGVWVASHPSGWAFFKYGIKASDRSTSEVLYFPRVGDTLGMPQRLVVPDSALRPASSVAVRLGNRMLIGSVADSALDCRFTGTLPR